MLPELSILYAAAASVAFVHTLIGPDHYLPLAALAQNRGWSMVKALRVTLYCGLGHLFGSIALGVVGLVAGASLARLVWMESARGQIAAWALLSLGLVYLCVGLRDVVRRRWGAGRYARGKGSARPLFLVFVLGPCEPLIPVLMFPAIVESAATLFTVVIIFSLTTLAVMTFMVGATLRCIRSVRRGTAIFGDYRNLLLGSVMSLCGASMVLGM